MNRWSPDHESMDSVVENTFHGLTLYDFRQDVQSLLRFDACGDGARPVHLLIRLRPTGDRTNDSIQDSLDFPLDLPGKPGLPGYRSQLSTHVRILRIGSQAPAAWSREIAAAFVLARDSGGWKTELPDRSRRRESDWLLAKAWSPNVPRTLLLELETRWEAFTRTDTLTLDLDVHRLRIGAPP
ncbi:MAG: hypothetical protein RL318_2406 [Fibrobacterota bacterium]